MKRNPFLKADDRLSKIYGNSAVLVYVDTIRDYDETTGEMNESRVSEPHTVSIDSPSVISEAVADGKNYLIGDLTLDISRLALEKALPSFRTASLESCGVNMEFDYIKFSGRNYRIVKMTPKTVWANQPSKYRVQLRANAAED